MSCGCCQRLTILSLFAVAGDVSLLSTPVTEQICRINTQINTEYESNPSAIVFRWW